MGNDHLPYFSTSSHFCCFRACLHARQAHFANGGTEEGRSLTTSHLLEVAKGKTEKAQEEKLERALMGSPSKALRQDEPGLEVTATESDAESTETASAKKTPGSTRKRRNEQKPADNGE